jgi:2-amino-4-hydroxy-6-hydroxymethyldihydropteridine diphosphokinase
MPETHVVYLAIGTNLGDRRANLAAAFRSLPPEVEVLAWSRLYETEPAYVLEQPNFLNMAIKARTGLSPAELLAYLKRLEEEIGREKTIRYGPREIDIDIVFYDDLVMSLPDLQLPHPRLAERAFVLRPVADIGPEISHPILQRTVAELADDLPADDGILATADWQPEF